MCIMTALNKTKDKILHDLWELDVNLLVVDLYSVIAIYTGPLLPEVSNR